MQAPVSMSTHVSHTVQRKKLPRRAEASLVNLLLLLGTLLLTHAAERPDVLRAGFGAATGRRLSVVRGAQGRVLQELSGPDAPIQG